MSVTHPDAVVAPVTGRFAERHPQLAPFLVATLIVLVSIAASLAVTGLPA